MALSPTSFPQPPVSVLFCSPPHSTPRRFSDRWGSQTKELRPIRPSQHQSQAWKGFVGTPWELIASSNTDEEFHTPFEQWRHLSMGVLDPTSKSKVWGGFVSSTRVSSPTFLPLMVSSLCSMKSPCLIVIDSTRTCVPLRTVAAEKIKAECRYQ